MQLFPFVIQKTGSVANKRKHYLWPFCNTNLGGQHQMDQLKCSLIYALKMNFEFSLNIAI